MAVETTDGRKVYSDGYYKHKETGAVVYLQGDPALGTPQIDAFIQLGYVYSPESEPKPEVVSEPEKVEKKK